MNESIISVVGRASRLLSRELQAQLEPMGIGLAEFRIVGLLRGEARGLSQNQLAELLGVTPPTLTVALQKLELKRVIERTTDPDDLRRKRVSLCDDTDLSQVEEMLAKLEAQITESLTLKEIAAGRRLLSVVAASLEDLITDRGLS